MIFKDNKHWSWFAERHLASQSVRLFHMAQGVNGKAYRQEFPESVTIEYDAGMAICDTPTVALNFEEADGLMQELWNIGLRPKGIEHSDEYVASLKEHIKSLQGMVDHYRKMDEIENTPVNIIQNGPTLAGLNSKLDAIINKKVPQTGEKDT